MKKSSFRLIFLYIIALHQTKEQNMFGLFLSFALMMPLEQIILSFVRIIEEVDFLIDYHLHGFDGIQI